MNDILEIYYKYGEQYKYDVIRFNMYLGNGKVYNKDFAKSQKSRTIYQTELSIYLFDGNNELELIDYNIANKFIKKTIYIESLNSLQNFNLNMYIISMENIIKQLSKINYIA